jgi:hypothetical protein
MQRLIALAAICLGILTHGCSTSRTFSERPVYWSPTVQDLQILRAQSSTERVKGEFDGQTISRICDELDFVLSHEGVFHPVAAVRLTNFLLRLPDRRRFGALREVAVNSVEQENWRRCKSLFLILQIMFVDDVASPPRRISYWSSYIDESKVDVGAPAYPILVVGDVPFLVCSDEEHYGGLSLIAEFLEFLVKSFKIRQEVLHPLLPPPLLVSSITQSTEWQALRFEQTVGKRHEYMNSDFVLTHLKIQSIQGIADLVSEVPDVLEEWMNNRLDRWTRLCDEVRALHLIWSEERQTFVPLS